jgi:hypothetical protein
MERRDIRASAYRRHSCVRMLDGARQLLYLSEQGRKRACMYMCKYILSRHRKFSRRTIASQRTIEEPPRSQLTAKKKLDVLAPCRGEPHEAERGHSKWPLHRLI